MHAHSPLDLVVVPGRAGKSSLVIWNPGTLSLLLRPMAAKDETQMGKYHQQNLTKLNRRYGQSKYMCKLIRYVSVSTVLIIIAQSHIMTCYMSSCSVHVHFLLRLLSTETEVSQSYYEYQERFI